MDLTSIKTNVREVEFTPNGVKTGFYLTLRYESAPEVQEAMKRYRAKVREATMKNKKQQVAAITDRFEDDLRAAHVAGWRWTEGKATFNGEQPDYTPKKLAEMLNDESELAFFLKQFIDQEVGSADDFLEKSGSS